MTQTSPTRNGDGPEGALDGATLTLPTVNQSEMGSQGRSSQRAGQGMAYLTPPSRARPHRRGDDHDALALRRAPPEKGSAMFEMLLSEPGRLFLAAGE
jgi:hypothetical protein